MLSGELTEACRALLAVMAKGPVDWWLPTSLALAMRWEVEETTDRLSDLDVSGWVEVREDFDGTPRVMISSLGAKRLGLRLVEVGPSGTLRWATEGEPDPPAPRARHVSLGAQGADLASIPDPGPDPELASHRGERAEAAARAAAVASSTSSPRPRPKGGSADWPLPSVLLGVGLTPWPGPGQSVDLRATCPACGSRKLQPRAYCLYCDRWGLDRLLGNAPSPDLVPLTSPPVPATRPPSAEQLRLQAERLRHRRKAKRRRKHEASLESDPRKR